MDNIDPVLLRAERDGLGSLLLDVQADCIKLRTILREFRDYAAKEITRQGAHHDQDNIWARVAEALEG